jgi:dCTP deaminase
MIKVMLKSVGERIQKIMLLSNRGVEEEVDRHSIFIQPYRSELMQPASYDVTLGPDFKLQTHFEEIPVNMYMDPREDCSHLFTDVHVPKGSEFVLEPGAFALGSTHETIALGSNITSRLEGKSSLGRLGLIIHATAGFIDPGFDGQITLELSNVGTIPILLIPGMKIGQLSFWKLPEPTTLIYGSRFAYSHYQNQAGPTCSRSYERFKLYDVYTPLDTEAEDD